jgi:hypothetical protein
MRLAWRQGPGVLLGPRVPLDALFDCLADAAKAQIMSSLGRRVVSDGSGEGRTKPLRILLARVERCEARVGRCRRS